MRKRTWLSAVALVAVLVVVGTACSKKTPTTTTTQKNVKIAFMGALTGGASALVVPGFQGVQLAFEQANAGKFGKLPVKIKVEGFDTQGLPTAIPPLATKVANDASFQLVWEWKERLGERHWSGGMVPRGPMVQRHIMQIDGDGGVTYTAENK